MCHFDSLTIWNKPLDITSMNSKSKLTKQERDLITLTPRIESILVGLLLSDAIVKHKGWNSRIGLKQSIIHFHFLWSVFREISIICSNFPYMCKTIKRGKLFILFNFKQHN